MQKIALNGLKIADFTWSAAGPVATKYLADYGATVVKIESSLQPDFLRTSRPFKDNKAGLDRAGFFVYKNSNKLSFALNLHLPKGIEVARRLAAWGDVVCESFRPGVMESMGLSYEELRSINPDIIMFRSSAQGQTGPGARQPLFGMQLTAVAGFTTLTGWPDRDPSPPFGAYTDMVAPRFGALAIMSALVKRAKTGKGTCIDLSQLEASLQFLLPAIVDYAANGNVMKRTGNRCDSAAPHGVYRCAGEDVWVAISVFSDEQWHAFCGALLHPEWPQDTRFKELDDRKRNEDELDSVIDSVTALMPVQEIVHRMLAAGVPASPVNNGKTVLEDQQLKARNYFWFMEHPEIGLMPHAGEAAQMSQTPARPFRPAPCLGEHTELVCREFLRMSDEEFLELSQQGVFE